MKLVYSLIGGPIARWFMARSIRFTIITLILVGSIAVLPKLVALIGKMTKGGFFGQVVRATVSPYPEFNKPIMWLLRPLQGIGLSMLFADRFLDLLEFSGVSHPSILARLLLFEIGSAPVALFLSAVWSLDDLGIKIYQKNSGQVRTMGSSVGVVLPLIMGAVGVSTLFHRSSLLDALIDLVGIVSVLYPPYVFLAVSHHEFLRRRTASLLQKLHTKTIETKVW
jgi:hypothetical protein